MSMGKPLSMVGYPDLGSLYISPGMHGQWFRHHPTPHHCLNPSNDRVECFHLNLKEALKANLYNPDWFQTLPYIILGIRTTPKEDLSCSTAERVYGTPLFIPGDFITSPNQEPNHRAMVREIRKWAAQLAPIPTTKPGNKFHPK